jgi:large subunit ribosomal protein L25
MQTKFEVTAEPRAVKGTGASRRLRRSGKVPGVLYGAERQSIMIEMDHSAILRNLQNEAFHTSILTVKVGADTDQVVLRDWQMHPFKPQVLHVDFQRISATEKIHMLVPLHFIGQDVAPGVKQEGGILSHLMTEVDITCLPHQLPEFLPLDVSQLHLNDSIHLSDIPLPDGVTITTLAHGGDDLAVATITTVHVVEEEITPTPAVAAEGAAAAAPETPAAEGDAKKTAEAAAAKKPEAKKEGK